MFLEHAEIKWNRDDTCGNAVGTVVDYMGMGQDRKNFMGMGGNGADISCHLSLFNAKLCQSLF